MVVSSSRFSQRPFKIDSVWKQVSLPAKVTTAVGRGRRFTTSFTSGPRTATNIVFSQTATGGSSGGASATTRNIHGSPVQFPVRFVESSKRTSRSLAMSGKMEENGIAQCASSTSPTRPPLSSHHSNSVPTTPYTRDRKLSFNGRSPSPKSNGRNTSPRSVRSMAEPGFRSKAPSFAGCRYESGFGFSKRRIPYSVGGDPLERMKAPPKKFLSREQESKLTGDMRELYDRLLPSPESDERRAAFVKKLESILNKQWPGSEIKVHVFGSSGNLLCTNDSDGTCVPCRMSAPANVV